MEVIATTAGLFLSQWKYICDIFTKTNMAEEKLVQSPMRPYPVLKILDGSSFADPMEYRSIIGRLQYLSLTRLDIAFTVNKLS